MPYPRAIDYSTTSKLVLYRGYFATCRRCGKENVVHFEQTRHGANMPGHQHWGSRACRSHDPRLKKIDDEKAERQRFYLKSLKQRGIKR